MFFARRPNHFYEDPFNSIYAAQRNDNHPFSLYQQRQINRDCNCQECKINRLRQVQQEERRRREPKLSTQKKQRRRNKNGPTKPKEGVNGASKQTNASTPIPVTVQKRKETATARETKSENIPVGSRDTLLGRFEPILVELSDEEKITEKIKNMKMKELQVDEEIEIPPQ